MTPRTDVNTACTPQKHPPATTIVSLPGFGASGASTPGPGMAAFGAAAAERPGIAENARAQANAASTPMNARLFAKAGGSLPCVTMVDFSVVFLRDSLRRGGASGGPQRR